MAVVISTRIRQLKIAGGIGILGAVLILLADLIYTLWGGDGFGVALYFPTFLGVFCFPFWWGGIWVIYQGLKPAGISWSLLPCLLFAYLVSTVNTAGHASYPYWAAFTSLMASENLAIVHAAEIAEKTAFHYSGSFLTIIQPILEVLICTWIMIPIVRGHTLFPRWIVVFIPVIPTVIIFALDVIIPGLFEILGPYLGSGSMLIVFALATSMLVQHERSVEGAQTTQSQ